MDTMNPILFLPVFLPSPVSMRNNLDDPAPVAQLEKLPPS